MNRLFSDFFRDFWEDFSQGYQIFGQIFGHIFRHVCDHGFLVPKYNVQYYYDGEIQCTVLPGQGKQTIYSLLFEIQKIPKSILDTLCYYLNLPLNSLFIDQGVEGFLH